MGFTKEKFNFRIMLSKLKNQYILYMHLKCFVKYLDESKL